MLKTLIHLIAQQQQNKRILRKQRQTGLTRVSQRLDTYDVYAPRLK